MRTKKTRLTTTLSLLRKHDACADGFRKLRQHVGLDFPDDAPINLLTVLESNGLDDTLWCLRATEQNCDKLARLFAADCASDVFHLYEEVYPGDTRPREAIVAARAFANGEIDNAARAVARSSAWLAAMSAARSVAESAARLAAWSAARSAARSADAESFAESVAESADAESFAESSDAESFAWLAARSAVREKQAERLRSILAPDRKSRASGKAVTP